jgi:glyoxylase I family protein
MSISSKYLGLHHVSLLVTDLDRSCDFYMRVLGMEEDKSRPDMAFSGMWLMVGKQQIHLLSLDKAASGTAAEHPGLDAHFALSVADIKIIADILTQEGVQFHNSKSGRKALFCRDPDGNGIEFVELVN